MRKRLLLLVLLFLPIAAARADPGPLAAPPPHALSPGQAVTAALADLDKQAVEDAAFLRYLYLPSDPAAFYPALRLHLNLLSREAQLAYPLQIAQGLWRIDLRDFQINPKVWEKLGDIDPYFHRKQNVEVIEVVEVERTKRQAYGYTDAYGQQHVTEYRDVVVKEKEKRKRRTVKNNLFVPLSASQLASLALISQSNAPIVRADWFLAQSARQTSLQNKENTGVGYYDFLELRNRDDFFKLIGEDQQTIQRIQSEIRAVVGESGVTQQNRQIVRTGAQSGGHWTTLEVDDQSGKGIAIQELRRDELLHVAEEHYGVLPNGLPATFLSDAKGVRQSSVPDKIAGDNSPLNVSRDFRVHVNLACMRCHAGSVLQPIVDDVRPVYTGRLSVLSNDKAVALELRRQYGANLDRALQNDRQLYQDALTAASRLTPKEAANSYTGAFNDYAYRRMTLNGAAAEYGVSGPQFLKALKDAAQRQGASDFRFDPFLTQPPRTISRQTFEDGYQDGGDLLFGVLKVQP